MILRPLRRPVKAAILALARSAGRRLALVPRCRDWRGAAITDEETPGRYYPITEVAFACRKCGRLLEGVAAPAHGHAHGREHIVVACQGRWETARDFQARCPICKLTGSYWEIERHHRAKRLRNATYRGTQIDILLPGPSEPPGELVVTPPPAGQPSPDEGKAGPAAEVPPPPPASIAMPPVNGAGALLSADDPAKLSMEIQIPVLLIYIWDAVFRAQGYRGSFNEWLVNVILLHYAQCRGLRLPALREEEAASRG